MNTTQKTRQQLDALATHFDSVRECILQRWRITTESAPEMTIASSLTRLQFNDHIPGVLDSFVHTLRTWPDETSAQAQQQEKDQVTEHGVQRWQQGYQLRELTREWGHLQTCLMEELETYAAAHRDLQPEVMPTARRTLANLCWDGISDSSEQYWRLHQAEAAGHVRDLEQALATLNQLEQTRAEAWREAAHDLRGSMTVVEGSTTLLQSEDIGEPARSQVLEMLQRSVQTLHEMLNDLMSLARLEAGHEQLQVAPFDAATLLTDFCTTSLPLAHARGLYLKMEGPASLPVEGDRAKVQRILQNLLLNALKYTRRGGVTVLWGNKEGSDQGWTFCVQDTGPGLDSGPGAPLARQLYEATQSAREVQKGNGENAADHVPKAPTVPTQSQILLAHQLPGEGIGLSIVKRLCELLDASLELETSPGEGSTFRVTLPIRYASSGIA